MPTVFVNYRTGDAEAAASLLEKYLADRFGRELIYRDTRSIAPGVPFDEDLIAAVRSSEVLLAVMGPGWDRFPELHSDDDWVRREILEAHEEGVPIIPVLLGRAAPRVSGEYLPPQLRFLVKVKSWILDTHDHETSLPGIGNKLADLVPTLRAAEQALDTRSPGSVHNEAEDVDSSVQAGSITGNVTNSRDTYGGPVNQGPHIGDNHYGVFPEQRDRSPRKRDAEDLRELDRCFVPPRGYEEAARRLQEPGTTVFLRGAPGSGRVATARILVKRLNQNAKTIHELYVADGEEDASAPFHVQSIQDDQWLWADLTDSGTWSWPRIRKELASLRYAIAEHSARLVAVLPGEGWEYDDEIDRHLVSLIPPPVTRVLQGYLADAGISLPADLSKIAFVTDGASSLRQAREYAARVAEACERAPSEEFAHWAEIAYQQLSGNDAAAGELLEGHKTAADRALLLAAAMLPGAHADAVEYGAARLLTLTSARLEESSVLEQQPLRERLEHLSVAREPDGRVRYQSAGIDAALRAYCWTNLPALHKPLWDWTVGMVESSVLSDEERNTLVFNFAGQCAPERYAPKLALLVGHLAHAEKNEDCQRAAELALTCGLREEQTIREFRRWIYQWARDEKITERFAGVLVAACRDELAVRYPESALIRLLHLARRFPQTGARAALAALLRNDRDLVPLVLDRLGDDKSRHHRREDSLIFLEVVNPLLFAASGPGDDGLITDQQVRSRLVSGWRLVFATADEGQWSSRVEDWLRQATADSSNGDAIMSDLASAAVQGGAGAQLYARARAGADQAAALLLLDKITVAQAELTMATNTSNVPASGSPS